MIKNRIAAAAAIWAFGFAALGGIVVTMATPAHAETGTTSSSDSSSPSQGSTSPSGTSGVSRAGTTSTSPVGKGGAKMP
ncbi:hypothetical protein [Mycolicibacterium sp. P1-5]|uniref:hypothetical protein n=1 Tax=Mycolicibacterium sp. P1-5 TaxID=2024617 RepID=UPI0011EF9288|nr:hypothetical protein [Mycolicibacterium sp. P1-5]KAA0109867.1 hypothetical protein CIW47_09795 [Mycolicibacterium sp. P1-5]